MKVKCYVCGSYDVCTYQAGNPFRLLDASCNNCLNDLDISKLNQNNCNCKHKGECYKTLGEHGYKVTNCKGLVE